MLQASTSGRPCDGSTATPRGCGPTRQAVRVQAFPESWMAALQQVKGLQMPSIRHRKPGDLKPKQRPELGRRQDPSQTRSQPKPQLKVMKRKARPPKPIAAVTAVEVSPDLTVLVDVKRRRLVYLICAEDPTNASKIVKLLRLTAAKLVWIVSESSKQHAGLASKLMNSVPCTAWEILTSQDRFHPAQLAMFQAHVAPSPSDGITMALQRAAALRDLPDRVASRIRRPKEDALSYWYLRQKRARQEKKRRQKESHPELFGGQIPDKYKKVAALLLQPQTVPLTDEIMLARNRDVEIVWHLLTQNRLGLLIGRVGRVLGFLKPMTLPFAEDLKDSDFTGYEVTEAWQVPDTDPLAIDTPPNAGDADAAVIDVEAVPAADAAAARAAAPAAAVPDPTVPYPGAGELYMERELARGMQQGPALGLGGTVLSSSQIQNVSVSLEDAGLTEADMVEMFGSDWELQLAAMVGVTDSDSDAESDSESPESTNSAHSGPHLADSDSDSQPQPGTSGRVANDATVGLTDTVASWSDFDGSVDAEGAAKVAAFAAKLAACSQQGELTDEALTDLMETHRALLQQGLVPDSISSGSLTLTTNTDGQGIIIQHDPRASQADRGTAGGDGDSADAGPSGGDGATPGLGFGQATGLSHGLGPDAFVADGGFNCQLVHASDEPNNMTVLIQTQGGQQGVGDGGSGPGRPARPSPSYSAGSEANRAFLEICYTGVSNPTVDVPAIIIPPQRQLPSPAAPSKSPDSSNGSKAAPSNTAKPGNSSASTSQPRNTEGTSSSSNGASAVSVHNTGSEEPDRPDRGTPAAASGRTRRRHNASSRARRGGRDRGTGASAGGEDATSLARDLLGRDVSVQEAEELAAALQEAESGFFDVTQPPTTSDSVRASSTSTTSQQPSSSQQSASPTQPSRPGTPAAGVSVQQGGGTVQGGEGSRQGGSSSTSSGTGTSEGTDEETAGDDDSASAAAAIGGARVTVDSLVAALREKMNAAFGVTPSPAPSRSRSRSRGRHGAAPAAAAAAPARRGACGALPGVRARAFNVHVASRVRAVLDGWTERRAEIASASPPRAWGTQWQKRGPANPTTPIIPENTIEPEPEGCMTYLQAACTVARLMEMLHAPGDNTVNPHGQDLVIVLPGKPAPLTTSPSGPTAARAPPPTAPEPPIYWLASGDTVLEYDHTGAWIEPPEAARAFRGGLDGDGNGDASGWDGEGDDDDLWPLEVVARNVGMVWSNWEQELMAPGVQAAALSADEYLATMEE